MEGTFVKALVEFKKEPIITENGELECRVTVFQRHNHCRQDNYELNWYLPEGWRAEGKKHVFVNDFRSSHHEHNFSDVKIYSGESISANNRIILEIRNSDHASSILIPLTVLG